VTITAGPRRSAFHGGFRIRFLQHCRLDGLTFAVQLFKPLGDRLCLRRIIKRKKAAAKRRIANPPARIDAGADQKSQMIGRNRPVDTGAPTERRQVRDCPGRGRPAGP
jgi:hypothetical protein